MLHKLIYEICYKLYQTRVLVKKIKSSAKIRKYTLMYSNTKKLSKLKIKHSFLYRPIIKK